jgi:biopolymer transport protein ExbD
MMSRRWRRRCATRDAGDINITAFMNLMVILVPFLLITAVFSRVAILELTLPAGAAAGAAPPPEGFALEVVLRKDGVEVGDRNGGLIRRIAALENGYDYTQLSELLQLIKARYPEEQDVTLLLEADIEYDVLVQTMDAVRIADTVVAGSVVKVDLFPEISIGDAPPAQARVAAAGGR